MKIFASYSLSCFLLLLGFSLAACLKYKTIPDCDLRAGFTVASDTIYCSSGTCPVQFIDSSKVFPDLEYEWDFRDGSAKVFGRTPAPHNFAPNNSIPYRVLLTVRLGEGCMDTFARNIYVLDGGPVARFTSDQAMDMCFTNESVTFTSQSTNYDSIEWSFGDGSTFKGVGSTVSHSYAVADDYTVRLTAIRGTQRNTFSLPFKVKAHKFEISRADLGPARKVKQLSDRSYAIIGNSIVGGKSKPYLMFVGEKGTPVQILPITTVGDDAKVADFDILPNGSFVLVGTTFRKVGSNTTPDIFYLWLDAVGNVQSTLGLPISMRSDNLEESASSIIVPSTGGIMITGRVFDPNTNTSHIYLFKSATNLNNIDMNLPVSLPDYEEGIAAVEVSVENFVVLGQTRTNAFSATPDILFFKVNKFGAITGNTHTSGNASSGEFAVSISKAADGMALMICGTTTSNGNQDFYLVKTDLAGNPLGSAKIVPDASGVQQISKEISPTKNGGFLIVGIQGGNPCFFTTDANGNNNPIKTYSMNGTEGFISGLQTTDGGFILAGYLENTKLYLVKTDKNGNFN
ncbi:MAG: PKD domain-containing protein [Phycisphaerae bacterium]|nr:PKD domain-containing protein [Saprospiraceae bacterium]